MPVNLTSAQVKEYSDKLTLLRRLVRTEEEQDTVEGMASLLVHSAREAAVQEVISSLEQDSGSGGAWWSSWWLWVGALVNCLLSVAAYWFYKRYQATKASLQDALALNRLPAGQHKSAGDLL